MFLMTGCGGATGGSTSGSTLSGNTTVVVMASSTANDQLSEFSVTLTNVSLVDQSGKTVTLLSAPVSDDFIHVNGRIEPLATVAVPQGTYTSAQATVTSALPECAGQNSGQLLIDEALGNIEAPGAFKVNLPQPIAITGTTMGLVLNLQVAASAPISGVCSSSLTNTVRVTPVFNLTPFTIAAQPTNSANGRMQGLRGIVSAIGGGSGFTATAYYSVNAGYPASWQISLNGSTAFQGIVNASQLAEGMPIDMDVNVQPDGSLLATRVAVPDTNTSGLNTAYGPPLALYPGRIPLDFSCSVCTSSRSIGLPYGRERAIQHRQCNLPGLRSIRQLAEPSFYPVFSSANMVDGQNIFFSVHGSIETLAVPPPMTTVELLPQSINGAVSAVSSAGNFTMYTVTLAPYDLFPNLAVQPGQTTLLASPNTVVVYADSTTQMLNLNSIGVGGVFRFYGLVLNDGGTLRMDCAQLSDGVPE